MLTRHRSVRHIGHTVGAMLPALVIAATLSVHRPAAAATCVTTVVGPPAKLVMACQVGNCGINKIVGTAGPYEIRTNGYPSVNDFDPRVGPVTLVLSDNGSQYTSFEFPQIDFDTDPLIAGCAGKAGWKHPNIYTWQWKVELPCITAKEYGYVRKLILKQRPDGVRVKFQIVSIPTTSSSGSTFFFDVDQEHGTCSNQGEPGAGADCWKDSFVECPQTTNCGTCPPECSAQGCSPHCESSSTVDARVGVVDPLNPADAYCFGTSFAAPDCAVSLSTGPGASHFFKCKAP